MLDDLLELAVELLSTRSKKKKSAGKTGRAKVIKAGQKSTDKEPWEQEAETPPWEK